MIRFVELAAASGVAALLCLAGCGVDEVAQGDAAQQRLSLVKPVNKGKLPAGAVEKPTPKVDVERPETPEQRTRRLANESTRDRCLEQLQAALGATSHEYNEQECSLKFKKGANSYIKALLNSADATMEGRKLIFRCRSSQLGCVYEGSTPYNQPQPSTVTWTVNNDADVAALQRCLDFLHERCKQM
ncbi:MAG: hypothetical protein R3A79_28820 [Nannocystaceae bacterium]